VRVSRRLVNPTRWMALAGNWKAPLTLAADSGRMTGHSEVMHLSANGNCALGWGNHVVFRLRIPCGGAGHRCLCRNSDSRLSATQKVLLRQILES
jgi:hypothetical protein